MLQAVINKNSLTCRRLCDELLMSADCRNRESFRFGLGFGIILLNSVKSFNGTRHAHIKIVVIIIIIIINIIVSLLRSTNQLKKFKNVKRDTNNKN